MFGDTLTALGLGTLNKDRNVKTDDNATKKQILKEYLTLIQKQNELFEEVPSFFMLQFGQFIGGYTIDDISTNLSNISGAKDSIKEFCNIVEQFVTNNTNTPTSTKFASLRSQVDLPISDCVQLLLFPRRFANVFIESLANILIVLKHNSSILTDLARIDNGVARDFFMVNIEENALVQTQQHDIEDNRFYFLDTSNQNTQDFWDSFIIEMSGAVATPLGQSPQPPTSGDDWVKLLVKVFLYYKQNNVEAVKYPAILKLFDGAEPSTSTNTDLPIPTGYLDIPLTETNSPTLRTLLGIVSFDKLQFILQLAYLIQKNEDEVRQQFESETNITLSRPPLTQ